MKFLFLTAALISCLEQKALYYIGARESGYNSGKHIEDLQRKCGLPVGEKYCACYIYIKHKECGVTDLPKQYNRAAAWGRRDKLVWERGDTNTDTIQQGMVVLYGETPETAFHADMVFKGVQEDGNGLYVIVDGGNTNGFNIIPGEGVHLKKIYLRNICAIADWITPKGETPVKFHIVEPQQNLFRISLKYKTSVEQLVKLNNLDSETVYIGQKLRVE